MRVLFVTTGSSVTVYAVSPLATALRNAGHEVVLTTNDPLLDAAREMGIPAVSYLQQPIRHFLTDGPPEDEDLDTGRALARMALGGLGTLRDVAEGWRPDVVVGSAVSYVAGLLAAHLGVPYVRYAEYLRIPLRDVDLGAAEGLAPELGRLGLPGLPEPDLLVDVCPPSLGSTPLPGPRQRMRFVPRNPQRPLEPWMFTRPRGRRRVLITSGTHFRMLAGGAMRRLVDELVREGCEVVVTAAAGTAAEFGPMPEEVRVGWIPLDVVAGTCDLVVHHCGATTGMTVMTSGAAELITPAPNPHCRAIAEAVTGFGAALTIDPGEPGPGEDPAAVIAAGCRDLFADPRFAGRARALADEMAGMPTPSAVAGTIAALAA